jgi:Ca-activated chloride channel family protein
VPHAAHAAGEGIPFFSPRMLWNFLRSFTLCALIGGLAEPVWVADPALMKDSGVAIMLVLDMSGSMDLFDDPHTGISRFSLVKNEALQFIARRPHDLMGVVLFGATALSRCPLTFDKKLLCRLVDTLTLGDINPDGTVLSTGIGLAARRLASAEVRSKIIILITDGAPTPGDIDPSIIIPYCAEQGITIYTIGVGSERGGYARHPILGIVQVPTPLNSDLLRRCAQETGGEYYRVDEQHDLRSIYGAIDAREKTEFQSPIFRVQYDCAPIFFLSALIGILLEMATGWWWRRLL